MAPNPVPSLVAKGKPTTAQWVQQMQAQQAAFNAGLPNPRALPNLAMVSPGTGRTVGSGTKPAVNPQYGGAVGALTAKSKTTPAAPVIENRPPVPARPKPVSPPKAKPKGTPGRANTVPVDAKPLPRTPAATTSAGSGGYTPLTPQAAAHLAQLQASQAINFQVQPLLDEINRTNEQSTQHAAAVAGFAKAMGELTSPVGQNLTNAYGSAANAVATYGKGYSSDTLKQDAGANAVGAAPELNAAQRAAVQAGYSGMPSDVMYGLHGADPATSLRQLGTALGGIYSAALPSAATSAGQQWLSSAQSQALAQLQALQDKVAQTRGGYPTAYQSALSAIQTADRQNQGIQLTRDSLNARTAATAAATANAARKVDTTMSKAYGVQMNSHGEVLTGKNGKPVLYPGSPQHVNTTLSKWYKVLVDNNMVAIRDAAGKLIPVPDSAYSTGTSKYNGLTKGRYTELQAQALGLARILHKPSAPDKSGTVHPPASWQEYLDHALAKKIPMWLIIEQGRRVYSQAEIHEGRIPGTGPSGG